MRFLTIFIDIKNKTSYIQTGDIMKSVKYIFDMYDRGASSYIFQTVKDRPLSNLYHSHDFFEFIVVLEGECIQIVNEEEFLCSKGEMIILCPEDKHKFISQSADLNLLAISVKNEEAKAFEKLFSLGENTLKTTHFPLSTERINAMLRFYFAEKEYEYKQLLSEIVCACEEQNTRKSNLPQSLEKAICEMKNHANLKEGTDRLVFLSGYSKTHLTRLMKKHLNKTPHELVLELRLDVAYSNVLLSSKPLEEISEELGYESFSHFQQIFKKRYGITPAALRRKQKYKTV
jgi:AraC family cel operon transcriptional repressor